MNIQLKDIGALCGKISKTIGSLRYLYFFLPENVAKFGKRLCCPVVALPELISGERMYLWRVDIDSPGLNENSKDSKHNTFFQQTVPFSIKRQRVESTLMAQVLKDKRVHVVIEDFHKEQFLIKNAKLESNREINTSRTGFTGWKFNLKGKSRLPLAHIKPVAMYGIADCSSFFTNVTLPDIPPPVVPTVITDDFGTAISDDFGTLIKDDL